MDYTVQYLLYTSLQSLSSITILLEQVFIMIDIIITLVAAYVIYILMTNSIKEKVCAIDIECIVDLKWLYYVLSVFGKQLLRALF